MLMNVQDAQIVQASEQSNQAAEAARKLGLPINTYKRKALKLGVYKTNQGLKGSKKPRDRVYLVDDNAFQCVSIKNAYALGFIAADGTIVDNKLRVNINARDRSVLVHLLSVMNSNYPIHSHIQHYTDDSGVKHEFDALNISITWTQIVDDLSKFGIVPRKQHFNIDFLENIPNHLKMPFIFGLFDGDGYVYFNESTKSKIIGIAQNYSTVNQIYRVFYTLGIEANFTDRGTYYLLEIRKKQQLTVFYNLYKNYAENNFVLDRKLSKIKQMLKI